MLAAMTNKHVYFRYVYTIYALSTVFFVDLQRGFENVGIASKIFIFTCYCKCGVNVKIKKLVLLETRKHNDVSLQGILN